jgi:tetratricopeptide (TPR) repeat protein
MRDALGHAERRLRRALAADPHLDEARLRLGDVLLVLGRPKEAAAEIEAVLAKSADPDLLCPAHLFLGGMHEQAGRLADAIKSYRDALDLDPTGQTPNLALSAALDASGDAAGARDALERALAEAGDAHELAHPWWVFQLGQSKRLDALLEALREESAS